MKVRIKDKKIFSQCFFVMSLLWFFANKSYDFIDITKLGYEQYQDIIINNVVVKPASTKVDSLSVNHDCQSRYQIIKLLLDKYERPFTLLDIGASQGYYSFRAAYDYNTVCVMIDGNNKAYPYTGTQLEQLCILNNLDNIILLKKPIIIEDLQRMGECEHFDVVLALNIIHRFGNRWQEIADAILALGDNIVIETPPNEDRKHKTTIIEKYLLDHGAESLGQVKRHTTGTPVNIYLIKANKNYLSRRTWIYPEKTNRYIIQSNFEEKKLIKHKTSEESIWVPGINLITFKMYAGTYPTKVMLEQALEGVIDPKSQDWMPNNMIIQGKKFTMIDGGVSPYTYKVETYNQIKEWIQLDDPMEIKKYFWLKLAKWSNVPTD